MCACMYIVCVCTLTQRLMSVRKEKTMKKEIKELEYNYIECVKGSDLLK